MSGPAAGLIASGHSQANIYAGSVISSTTDAIEAFFDSVVNIYGGSISGTGGFAIDAESGSTINIYGGAIRGFLIDIS